MVNGRAINNLLFYTENPLAWHRVLIAFMTELKLRSRKDRYDISYSIYSTGIIMITGKKPMPSNPLQKFTEDFEALRLQVIPGGAHANEE
ncbi:unnamed protein product [Lota lota]